MDRTIKDRTIKQDQINPFKVCVRYKLSLAENNKKTALLQSEAVFLYAIRSFYSKAHNLAVTVPR